MTVDITLYGATGYTGGLLAQYLSSRLPAGATWAIAGRNREKLASIAASLAEAGGKEPTVVTAELSDPHSMRSLAEGTRVLASTVGPYLKYGMPTVRAAAEAGIGYLDLTGEPQFVDEVWLELEDTAVATGARLIHACGFDSIPYDLGVLYTVGQLPDDVPITVQAYVHGVLGASGGTYHSAINQFSSLAESARVAKRRRSREPRPDDRRVRGAGSISRTRHASGWAVPLPTIDPQIVLRTARALPSYGPDFTYEHYAHIRTTPMLLAGGIGVGSLAVGSQIPALRRQLLKLKTQGEGPSEEQRAKAWFTVDMLTATPQQSLHTRVSGRDPGYGGTAKMLGESALCLAFDDLPEVRGQSTTAVALGQRLIDRLSPEALRFETIAD